MPTPMEKSLRTSHAVLLEKQYDGAGLTDGRCNAIGYMGLRQGQEALQCSIEERNIRCHTSAR